MKKLMSAVFGAIAALCLFVALPELAHGGEGHAGKKSFTKHFDGTLFDITRNAAFSVEVLLDDAEYKIEKDVIGIVLHDDGDGDVVGAEITISLKDLEGGEGLRVTPSITDRKSGLYIVSGLDLKSCGRCEFGVTVRKGDVEDGVTFILPDAAKKPHPKGKYLP